MSNLKAIIIIAGYGKRFPETSKIYSKGLIPIFDKVLVKRNYDLLREWFKDEDIAVIIGNHTPDLIKHCLGDGVTYIHQDEQSGLADAVYLAKDFIGDDRFITLIGDSYFSDGFSDFILDFDNEGGDANIMLVKSPRANQFGMAFLNSSGTIIKFEEKPEFKIKDIQGSYLSGIYGFTPRVFKYIENQRRGIWDRKWLSDTLQEMLIDKREIKWSYCPGYYVPVNNPKNMLTASLLEAIKLGEFD